METINSGNKGKEAQWLPKHNAVRMVSMVKDTDWPHRDSCADLGWKFYPDHWNIWIINVYKKIQIKWSKKLKLRNKVDQD